MQSLISWTSEDFYEWRQVASNMFGIALNEMRADFNKRREVSHRPFLVNFIIILGEKDG